MENRKLIAARHFVKKLRNNTGKDWPNINSVLGSGTNGITFTTKNTPPKVLKIARGNATREVNALKKLVAAGANFVPRVNGNYVEILRQNNSKVLFPYSNKTIYVMNKVGNMSLWTYARTKNPNNNTKRVIRLEIQRAVKFMHNHGISHGDLHSGNILVELDPKTGKFKKLWVIDFGRYVNIPVGANEKAAYNKLVVNSIHDNYNLFNKTRTPKVNLYSGPTGGARKNTTLMKEMYGIV